MRRALKQPTANIWRLVGAASDLEEHQFNDAVDRRLRTGRILLLIIGDGIQEGVEALAEHLQLHAGTHAGMALVDLSIWSDPAGGLLVVPRVPMRTVLIERGIVTFDPGVWIQVEAPPTATSTATASRPRAVTASEPEFYARRPSITRSRSRRARSSPAGPGSIRHRKPSSSRKSSASTPPRVAPAASQARSSPLIAPTIGP